MQIQQSISPSEHSDFRPLTDAEMHDVSGAAWPIAIAIGLAVYNVGIWSYVAGLYHGSRGR